MRQVYRLNRRTNEQELIFQTKSTVEEIPNYIFLHFLTLRNRSVEIDLTLSSENSVQHTLWKFFQGNDLKLRPSVPKTV
jgi:hypothetical protein